MFMIVYWAGLAIFCYILNERCNRISQPYNKLMSEFAFLPTKINGQWILFQKYYHMKTFRIIEPTDLDDYPIDIRHKFYTREEYLIEKLKGEIE